LIFDEVTHKNKLAPFYHPRRRCELVMYLNYYCERISAQRRSVVDAV